MDRKEKEKINENIDPSANVSEYQTVVEKREPIANHNE